MAPDPLYRKEERERAGLPVRSLRVLSEAVIHAQEGLRPDGFLPFGHTYHAEVAI